MLLCTDLRWISVQHHEAKLLRADAAEVDVVGATGGDDAVEERHSLLAGVARTPTVILRTWTHRYTAELKTLSLRFFFNFISEISLRTRPTVDQIHKAVSEHSDRGQTSGFCVSVKTLSHQHPVVQLETLVALPGIHVRAVFPDHTWGKKEATQYLIFIKFRIRGRLLS